MLASPNRLKHMGSPKNMLLDTEDMEIKLPALVGSIFIILAITLVIKMRIIMDSIAIPTYLNDEIRIFLEKLSKKLLMVKAGTPTLTVILFKKDLTSSLIQPILERIQPADISAIKIKVLSTDLRNNSVPPRAIFYILYFHLYITIFLL